MKLEAERYRKIRSEVVDLLRQRKERTAAQLFERFRPEFGDRTEKIVTESLAWRRLLESNEVPPVEIPFRALRNKTRELEAMAVELREASNEEN